MTERNTAPIRPIPDRPPSPSSPNRRRGAVVSIAANPATIPAAVPAARMELNVYSLVVLDIVGSAAREGRGQRRMRDDLYGLMAEVTDMHGLDLESLPFDDTGDGLRLVIPLDVMRPTRVVDAFFTGLAAGLREHNRTASQPARMRMRACFDLGLVEAHRRGWTGDTLVRAARLIDAPQVRQALDGRPDVNLVAVVSEPMFEVVRQRFGYLAPDCFAEIRVRVKEFDGRAWLLAQRSTSACLDCAARRQSA